MGLIVAIGYSGCTVSSHAGNGYYEYDNHERKVVRGVRLSLAEVLSGAPAL